MTQLIKRNLPALLFIVFILAVIIGIGLIATGLSASYKVELIKISSGNPPKAEIKVYAREDGNANIKISLYSKGHTLSASGTYSLKLTEGQTQKVVIPLQIQKGIKYFYGKEASYSYINVTINNKKYNWKWKK